MSGQAYLVFRNFGYNGITSFFAKIDEIFEKFKYVR